MAKRKFFRRKIEDLKLKDKIAEEFLESEKEIIDVSMPRKATPEDRHISHGPGEIIVDHRG
jgi:hypothetical protein